MVQNGHNSTNLLNTETGVACLICDLRAITVNVLLFNYEYSFTDKEQRVIIKI